MYSFGITLCKHHGIVSFCLLWHTYSMKKCVCIMNMAFNWGIYVLCTSKMLVVAGSLHCYEPVMFCYIILSVFVVFLVSYNHVE